MSFFSKKEGEQGVSSVNGGGSKKKNTLLISSFLTLFLLFVAASGVAAYFYFQYKNAPVTKTAEDELAQIKNSVGKLMELPDETPTLATINDKSKLEKSPFFDRAENGDKVLLYTNAKKAILYRPSTGKIIDVTTINVADSKATAPVTDVSPAVDAPKEAVADEQTATLAETPVSLRLALYNGTMKIGVTNTLEDSIIAKFPAVTVEKKEKAARSDYTETQVIDLSGKNADFVTKLAEAISGKVVAILPAGEVNPGTDILVIAGQK